MRSLKLTFIALSFFLFGGMTAYPNAINAQGIPGVSSPVILDVSSTNPRPGDNVSFNLRSYSIDVNSATISWFVDGKKIQEGIGSKSFSVNAGNLGSIKEVSVNARTADGQIYTNSASIRPSDLTLFWEAGTYTPPFYKGKAMPVYGGTFRVIAIPDIIGKNGSKINSKNLVYTWSKNGTRQSEVSGYGKSTFITSQSTFVRQGDEIEVEITSPNDDFSLKGSITVTSGAPSIIFYEKSPLYGIIYEKALNNSFTLTNEEITVVAEPYSFSDVSKNSPVMTYSWTLNGETIPAFQNKNSVTLRRIDENAGFSNLGLTIQNTVKLLQGANKNLNISYE